MNCHHVSINPNEMALGADGTQSQDIISLTRRLQMHRESITTPLPEQDSGNPSFNPALSQLLDLLIQHEESLRADLIKTKQLRQQLENLIPNGSIFKDFINTIED